MNFSDFKANFSNEERCAELLARLRWPDGPVCYRCGAADASKSKRPRYWFCRACRRLFSVTAGTWFGNIKLPMPVWFQAVWLVAVEDRSALFLSRELGVTYPTAWEMSRRIRRALKKRDPLVLGVVAQVAEEPPEASPQALPAVAEK